MFCNLLALQKSLWRFKQNSFLNKKPSQPITFLNWLLVTLTVTNGAVALNRGEKLHALYIDIAQNPVGMRLSISQAIEILNSSISSVHS